MIVYQTNIFIKWFGRLRDEMARAIIARRIRALETDGHFGDAKHVGEGVSEMRVHFGAGYRIYFVRRGAEMIILLAGGNKSGQEKDIRTAKKLAGEV